VEDSALAQRDPQIEGAFRRLWRFLDERRSEVSPSNLADLRRALTSLEIPVTSELTERLMVSFGQGTEHVTASRPLCRFVGKLLAQHAPESVLDPACGLGNLASGVAEVLSVSRFDAVARDGLTGEWAQAMLGESAKVLVGEPIRGGLEPDRMYDAIVSVPPFGRPDGEPIDVRGVIVRDDYGGMLACKCTDWLSPSGAAVFLLPARFAWTRKPRSARQALQRLGFAVRAFIDVPPNSVPGRSIPTGIVLLARGDQEQVFVGQYSDSHEHQSTLIKNLRSGINGQLPSQGRIVHWEGFTSFGAIESLERVERLARRMGLKPVSMREVVAEAHSTRPGRSFEPLEDRSNSVYLPLVASGAATTGLEELPERLSHYAQLVINREVADARFVAELFNQPIGQALRDAVRVGVALDRIDLSRLLEQDFFLPEPEVQQGVMGVLGDIQGISVELDELRSKLWTRPVAVDEIRVQVDMVNKEVRFEDWLETLPFPLASILWRYRASDGTDKEKYEILLHFFEALSEFCATVLLSAFHEDESLWTENWPKLKRALDRENLTFERATMGLWKTSVEVLAASMRRLLDQEPAACCALFRCADRCLLARLCSKKLVSGLQQANSIRNQRLGHTGAISPSEARVTHANVLELVQSIRGTFGRCWNDYELLEAHECRHIEGVFHQSVKKIMGTRSMPFESAVVKLIHPMEDGRLYLLGPGQPEGLQLLPFVKVMPSPRTEANACYFFNRREGGTIRLVSYYFESDADVTQTFSDVAEALDSIVSDPV